MLFTCLAVLSLCCFLKTFSSWGEQGLLGARASLVAGHRAPGAGASVVLAQLCLSGPQACGAGGSSPDQTSTNAGPLRWQEESQPRDHQGRPRRPLLSLPRSLRPQPVTDHVWQRPRVFDCGAPPTAPPPPNQRAVRGPSPRPRRRIGGRVGGGGRRRGRMASSAARGRPAVTEAPGTQPQRQARPRGQHERLWALRVLGGGAPLPRPSGLHREPAPAAHQSAEPSFRQGPLPGQDPEGEAAPRSLCLLPFPRRGEWSPLQSPHALPRKRT